MLQPALRRRLGCATAAATAATTSSSTTTLDHNMQGRALSTALAGACGRAFNNDRALRSIAPKTQHPTPIHTRRPSTHRVQGSSRRGRDGRLGAAMGSAAAAGSRGRDDGVDAGAAPAARAPQLRLPGGAGAHGGHGGLCDDDVSRFTSCFVNTCVSCL